MFQFMAALAYLMRQPRSVGFSTYRGYIARVSPQDGAQYGVDQVVYIYSRFAGAASFQQR